MYMQPPFLRMGSHASGANGSHAYHTEKGSEPVGDDIATLRLARCGRDICESAAAKSRQEFQRFNTM
jgi:hypothetical protein